MIDLDEMIKAQKIGLILSDDNVALWKPTMKAPLGQINLDVFLKSNFSVPKGIPVFYSDILKNINKALI